MWHPDRAATEQERTIAEAELKKVNGARDLIQRHHQDGLHRLVGCECSAEPVQDPRGSMYENTERTSERPRSSESASSSSQGASAGGASGAQARKTSAGAGSRRRKQPQTAPPVVASMITAAMVLLGMTIVKMNSGVKIERPRASDAYGYEAPAVQGWRGESRPVGGVSQSTIASLRPSLVNKAASTEQQAVAGEKVFKQEDTAGQRMAESEAQAEREAKAAKAREQQQALGKSAVEFVSADGRLISLQDGTTWELWPQEAADSLFAWQPGDRITVKGRQASMPWLVNDTRSHQAVKVTRVE